MVIIGNSSQFNYASFFSRFTAYLIDIISIYFITYNLAIVFGLNNMEFYKYHNDHIDSYDFLFYNGGWNYSAFGIWIIYSIIMDCSKYQGTHGKILLKLKVTDDSGNRIRLKQSILRNAFKLISMFPLALGFIWILFNDKNKGWHDIVAGTLVLKEFKTLIFNNKSKEEIIEM